MTTASIITIILLVIVIALLAYLVLSNNKVNHSSNNVTTTNDVVPINQGILTKGSKLAKASELLLTNSFGNEIVFTRPSEITDRKYKEITVNRGGELAQHAAGALMPEVQKSITLNQLKELAPNGLFTSQIPKAEMSTYHIDGSYSSVQYSSHGTKSHKGFLEVDSDVLGNVSAASIANITMQSMAAVSGQYYLKQITDSLKHIEKSVDFLVKLHKYEKVGILSNCRNTLIEITQKEYCDQADIFQIRNVREKAGDVLEEYKQLYSDKYNEVMEFSYGGGIKATALESYNEKIVDMKEYLNICMLADRIIDESRLAEIVARGKISISDPAMYELYRELCIRSDEGFNGKLRMDIHGTFSPMLEKANQIYDRSIEGSIFSSNEYRQKKLEAIKDNIRDIKTEVVDMTDSVYSRPEIDDKQEILLMLDEYTGDTRIFLPVLDL